MRERLKLWHLLLLIVVLSPLSVWGANTMFSALSTLTGADLTAGDEFLLVDVSDTTHGAGGTAKTITRDELQLGLKIPRVYGLVSDYTNSTTTGTEITGIGPMTAGSSGTYSLDCWLMTTNATAANGGDFGVNYTGTVTEMVATMHYPDNGTTATTGTADGTVTGDGGELIVAHGSVITESTTTPNLNVYTALATASENIWVHINSLLTVSDTGDFELWAASESTTQLTVQSGSYCTLLKVL
jgi:hypothetical protein